LDFKSKQKNTEIQFESYISRAFNSAQKTPHVNAPLVYETLPYEIFEVKDWEKNSILSFQLFRRKMVHFIHLQIIVVSSVFIGAVKMQKVDVI
jgi:hypothetical protein